MSNPALFASQRAARNAGLFDSILRAGGEPPPTPWTCAYPLDATAGEMAGPGFLPMTMDALYQIASVTMHTGQGAKSYLAAPAGFTDNTNAVFPLATGITVIEFQFPIVSAYGTWSLAATVVGGDFMTTVIQIAQSGADGVFMTTCGTFTDASTFGVTALAFNADTGNINLLIAGVDFGVVGTFTPGSSFALQLSASVDASQPVEAEGQQLMVQACTAVEQMSEFSSSYPGGSKTICGETIVEAPVLGFDPATLPRIAGRYWRYWHAEEATFMNGASPASPGDPVSKVVSQAASDTFDTDYFGGSSPTLRDDGPGLYLNMHSTTNMTSTLPGSFSPKSTGLTFAVKLLPGAGDGIGLSYLFCQDDSPMECGINVVQANIGPGLFEFRLRVYGDAGSYVETPGIDSYVAGGGTTLAYTLAADPGGSCAVKVFTDSATPFATGTVTMNGSMSRVREFKEQTIRATFFCAQDFTANITDILKFLNEGTGV